MEQVCEDLRRGEIVYRHDVELAAAVDVRAEKVAPDPPEPIDANLECHAPESKSSAVASAPAARPCRAAHPRQPNQSSPDHQPMERRRRDPERERSEARDRRAGG